ncbi:UNVERIFIED_CONTAM: phage terminase small subunit P27 family [Limosilactobacillus fermentum]
MAQRTFYKQNDGQLGAKPPVHLSKLAGETWRKIVPFLIDTGRVERIDTSLVEMYCAQYDIYRQAYADVREHGVQTPIYKTVQNQMGDKIGTDFVGFKKNPAVATMKDATNQLTSIGVQLGLSPKGRAQLMSIAAPEKEESVADALKSSGLI